MLPVLPPVGLSVMLLLCLPAMLPLMTRLLRPLMTRLPLRVLLRRNGAVAVHLARF
jgi:hypothetical protein